MRAVFFRAWRNYRAQRPLEGIEKLIVDVARQHPEYHAVLDAEEAFSDRDYLPSLGETNPFMHMSLHIAIAEQLSVDQPPGIRQYYQQLLVKLENPHAVEHAMMNCLSESVWQATRERRAPDQNAYVDCVKRLIQKS